MNSFTLTDWIKLSNSEVRKNRYHEAIAIYDHVSSSFTIPAGLLDFNLSYAYEKLGLNFRPIFSANVVRGLAAATHVIDVDNGWESVGNDPSFNLQLREPPVGKGWYRIVFCISCEGDGRAAFYFNYGHGFNEKDSVKIPFSPRNVFVRYVHVRDDCVGIRFDPFEHKGWFSIDHLSIQKLESGDPHALMVSQMLAAAESESVDRLSLEFSSRAARGGNEFEEFVLVQYNALFEKSGALSYDEWMSRVERWTLPDESDVKAILAAAADRPLVSVIVPVYNTEEKYLRACLDSVLAQSYPDWELCIADDASSRPYVRSILEEYQRRDDRIKVVFRASNGHISAASNSALELATSDYVALLDHDDILAKHALLFMVDAISRNPKAKVLYSDEDKIDADGRRFEPHFKSDWNPDLFYSQNYISHLGVYRRSLLNHIGGFRFGVEGSQDQDLLLRCLPHVAPDEIIHISRILYHWRTVEGSTALASGEKSYTTDAGIKALTDYFAEVNPEVRVEAPGSNIYRVRWPIPEPAPLVSLLIPTRDKRELTETCVRSILDKTSYENFEILILDNGSVEKETLDFFEQIQREDARVRVLRYDHPFNYSAINNFGVRHARGTIIGLVNNDIEVISPEWLSEMVSHAVRPEIGCVGAKLYYSNDTLQHAGVICSLGGVAGHSHKHFPGKHPGYFHRLVLVQQLSAVTAACLLVRRSIYEEVGGLDEVNLHVAFNDVDFCLKVREAGYRNLWTPYAELYHHESISRGHEDTPEKRERFNGEVNFMKSKWGDALKYDPCYNLNLTKDREDFSL